MTEQPVSREIILWQSRCHSCVVNPHPLTWPSGSADH